MRGGILVKLALAACAGAAFAAAFRPEWRLGAAVDSAGAAFSYGNRRAAPVSDDIVLVEIDDAAVAEFGPWPWDEGVVGKFFEAPFVSAKAIVSLVPAEEFEFAGKSGEIFERALAGLEAAVPVRPFEAQQPSVEAAAALGKHPGGGQGELVRDSNVSYQSLNTRLPQWREEVIRNLAAHWQRSGGGGTAEDFVAQILGPYWVKSTEVRRLAEFWFAQAKAAEAVASAARVEGFNEGDFTGLGEVEWAYVWPTAGATTGIIGWAAGPPREAALVLFRDKPLVRLGISAAAALDGYGGPVLEGRTLSVTRRGESAWQVELDGQGRILPDWTGNAATAWDARFRRFSAGALVEAANARRATWEGYRAYEASAGGDTLTEPIKQYERAAWALDYRGMDEAGREIAARTNALLDRLGMQRAQLPRRPERRGERGTDQDAASQEGRFVSDIMALEFDEQALRSSILDAFVNRVVVIAPTAEQFETIGTPWGKAVPEAALEVSLMNSVLTGRTVRQAPAWAWWAAALAGGMAATFVGGRLGAGRGGMACAGGAAAGLYALYALFSTGGVFLGLSCLGPLLPGYCAGSAAYHFTTGRRRRHARRLLAGHIAREDAGRAIAEYGAGILATTGGAGVLSVEFDMPPGSAVSKEVIERYARGIVDAIFDFRGLAVEAGADVEGAFGWLGAGDPVERAVSAGQAARKHLKLLTEKLSAQGTGTLELRMGIGAGEGRLGAGAVTGATLVGSGEAFARARAAAGEARRRRAGVVVCGRDIAKVEVIYEVRRLDAGGAFYEILERKGALPVRMRRARELYERAIDESAAGRRGEARALLEEALVEVEDGPSRALLEELTAGAKSAGG